MKRLVTIVLSALAGMAITAAVAPAGPERVAKPPTAAQFNALKKRVTTIEAVIGGCLAHKAVAVNSYNGYVYKQPDGSETTTTAINLTTQGTQVQYYVLAVHPQCAAVIGGGLQRLANR